MKIYLAHNFEARNYLRERVDGGAFGKHEVTSSWIRDGIWSDDRVLAANTDWEDLKRADAIVVFLDQFGEKPGKGKYWEWGAAFALQKIVILIGESNCVFSFLPTQFDVTGIEEARQMLDHLEEE